jgi:hypothetical protein
MRFEVRASASQTVCKLDASSNPGRCMNILFVWSCEDRGLTVPGMIYIAHIHVY